MVGGEEWERGFFFSPCQQSGVSILIKSPLRWIIANTHCLLLSLFSFVFSFLAFSSLLYNILFQFL